MFSLFHSIAKICYLINPTFGIAPPLKVHLLLNPSLILIFYYCSPCCDIHPSLITSQKSSD